MTLKVALDHLGLLATQVSTQKRLCEELLFGYSYIIIIVLLWLSLIWSRLFLFFITGNSDTIPLTPHSPLSEYKAVH